MQNQTADQTLPTAMSIEQYTVTQALNRCATPFEPGQEAAALLPILHAVQDQLGYIPPAQVGSIAKALNLSRAEVHGVITYYHHFRQSPLKGKHVQVCRAEACRAVGGEALWQHACARHGGAHTVEAVYCLGFCANGPSAQVGDKPVLQADAASLDAEVGI